ncbi:MAG: hypothetical protein FWG34_12020 [Oscillospiraceae bacterium]|nr:hypothetical protein [Oscillospiraceae bacterium]
MFGKKFKTIGFLFVICFVLICLSCSSGAEGNGGETGETGRTAEQNNQNIDADAVADRLYPDLGEKNFEGHEFKVLAMTTTHIDWEKWKHRDIYAEDENGEPINDAVYKRNRYVEDKYNCVVSEILAEDHMNVLAKSVRADDDEYELFYTTLGNLAGSAATGNYMDLNEFPVIGLDAPWWDINAKKSLSIGGKLYFCPSDLILLHYNAASAIIFNKKMLKDYELEDLYSLASSGKWTIDKLTGITKDIYQDINGDGNMDENDLYGIACYRDALLGIMHSAGGRICEKDGQDLPYLTLNSENAITALNKAFDLMYAPSAWNLHKELEPRGLPVYDITERMFMEDRVLFYSVLLRDVEQFRGMESDFGIIPVPKLTEAQQSYGSTVNQHVGRAIAVPVTVRDKERAGTIIEALTAESKYTLLPAYYDITLQRKVSRDNESEAMLDMIFSSRIYDPGAIYNFGNYSMDLIMMTMTQNRNVISLYEKNENRANSDIEKLTANLQKLEN